MVTQRLAKKINMQDATIKTWYRKNHSRLRITQTDSKGKQKSVVLVFKTQETLDTFADTVLDLLELLDADYEVKNDE